MPKINVYLPDDLAEAVKESGVPVSAICQRALEQSVKRVSAIRAVALAELDHEPELPRFTTRAKAAVSLAIGRASVEVGTEYLLYGVIAEGGNLALEVLRAVEISVDRITREVGKVLAEPTGDRPQRFATDAANALELAVTEAVGMGHNYIGCEHLLLGLISEDEGAGGQVLRAAGADLKSVRATIVAAVAGYAHLRNQGPGQMLEPLIRRIEQLEKRLGNE
ncbi:Clp protease N-terminal domain-containing protein [Actinocrispum wychmicini]|uniref:ATP-dependent Clp protease ATP-binding subunit ClpC n=1 Tax=Actinocrispum wychmicini TaxID=1213861 RepID=A0A4V6NNM3_9PSEU|nr:Clp protease N-terminal domain-containing protein [Actinocrispum wychmicini]TCO48820.1 ATP-dependent Clp protease ATP-binding subunit ClpC [Actinocrispum wychmicini]